MFQLETRLKKIGFPQEEAYLFDRAANGYVLGTIVSLEAQVTGIDTAIHEIVGHGYLGGHLVHDYLPHQLPRYEIRGFNAFWEIGNSKGIFDGIKRIAHWQTEPLRSLRYRAGSAWVRGGTPNALGKAMGKEGLSAWVSLTGSLPTLAINSTAVTAGSSLRNRYPLLAFSLIFFGLNQHTTASAYCWDAAFKSVQGMKTAAASGHDFANFALNISAMTGLSPRFIACFTAMLYTSIVPLCLLLTELRTHTQDSSKSWLLPLAAVALCLAFQVSRLLSTTILPNFNPLTRTLCFASPILQTVTLTQACYEAYRDVKHPLASSRTKVCSTAKATFLSLGSCVLFANAQPLVASFTLMGMIILPISLDFVKNRPSTR